MSVIGIDLGNFNTVIAVARNRGIDVICNEVSNRATPSLVSFSAKQRFLGESAKTNELGNYKNTVGSLKRLLGRSLNEKDVTLIEAKHLGCDLIDLNGSVGVKVQYQGEDKSFSLTQTLAMFLTKVKETAEKELGIPANDCVISIPPYYTESQRRSLIEAAEIAGLNPLRLLHDVSASALQWGITKSDLPDSDPKYVAFVDIGQSDTSVAIVAFVKGKMMVKSIAFNRHLGGRDFDQVLLDHFVQEFKEKYKIDINTNQKALYRLRSACEKVKKILSANAQAPINVECLMNDKDVNGMITREYFEELTANLRSQIDIVLAKSLDLAGVEKKDIDSVEVIGGTTRIPAVKQRISDFFGKEISTTLNQDECVSKGCAFMCAILSPVFKTREFKVEDIYPFPVKLTYDNGGEQKDMIAFSSNSQLPCTKLLTFYRKDDLNLEVLYSDAEVLPEGCNTWLGKYSVKNIKPTDKGEPSTVKIKVRLNPNGLLEIGGAQLLDEKVVESDPVKEKEINDIKKDANGIKMETDETADSSQEKSQEEASAEPKSKKLVKKIDLPVVGGGLGIPHETITQWKELEYSMAANDRLIFDTEERKNALEEYVYYIRGKLEDEMREYEIESVKEKFFQQLTETEDWLYGEGEDSTKSVYVTKLNELKSVGEPVVKRYREGEERPKAVEDLRQVIRHGTDISTTQGAQYSHIDAKEREGLLSLCQRKIEWLNSILSKQDGLKKHEDPVITVEVLRKEAAELSHQISTVMNKPKPQPKVEKAEKKDEKPEEKADKKEDVVMEDGQKKEDMEVDH